LSALDARNFQASLGPTFVPDPQSTKTSGTIHMKRFFGKPYTGVQVQMDPIEFLKKAFVQVCELKKSQGKTPPKDYLDFPPSEPSMFKRLKSRMRGGQPIDAPVLILDKSGKIIGHNGRNRAFLAHKLGIKSIPVMLKTLDTN